MRFMGWVAGLAGAAVVALSPTGAIAADIAVADPGLFEERYQPAVSGINGKLDGFAGVVDSEAIYAASGSVSIPVPMLPFMGVQIDAMGGGWNSEDIAGAGLHIFARRPDWGLIGIYGDWSYVSPEHYGRVGPEIEIYFGRFSLEAVGGAAFGQNVSDQWFNEVDLAFYPIEDLRLAIGHRYTTRGHMGAAGIEYQLPFDMPVGVSLFAEGLTGEDDVHAAWAGLRIYAAQDRKSLIRRHREDDPRSRLPTALISLTNCGTKIGEGAYCGSDDDLDTKKR